MGSRALPKVSPARVLLSEALHAVASPQVAKEVLKQALVEWDAPMPGGGSALAAFAQGPLRKVVERRLSLDAAEALSGMLQIISERTQTVPPADSSSNAGVERASRQPRGLADNTPTLPPHETTEAELELGRLRGASSEPLAASPDPEEASGVQVAVRSRIAPVLLVTQDFDRAHRLAAELGAEQAWCLVPDALTLLEVVDEQPDAQLVVVIDCQAPSVQPSTLAALIPEFDQRTEFVLWDATESTGNEWLFADRTETWVRCPQGAQLDQVAKAIRALLGLYR